MNYKCIVVDPPWEVGRGRKLGEYIVDGGKQRFGPIDNQTRKLAYPSMNLEEISKLKIKDISHINSHLYIWTINKFLGDVYSIAKGWGFTPSTMLVWAKNPMGGGLGGTFGISTEYCLFCRRGSLKAKTRIKGTWFNWKREYDERGKPKHSVKPKEFYQLVESVSDGPRIDIFARKPRDNWDVWGNEVENNLDINLIS